MPFIRLVLALQLTTLVFAVSPDKKTLPIGLAPHEVGKKIFVREAPSTPPTGEIHSLGEWEEADSAITLWTNPSLVSELAKRGPTTLIADDESAKSWWDRWLDSKKISKENIRYEVIPTDSIWIRDYGPWYIVDGNGKAGLVDTIYNRPRPLDDEVPSYLADSLNLPIFRPSLIHTGGNYYSDSLGNAFSSTLPYTENINLSEATVNKRMLDFLGIENYVTSKLAPQITIEHIDTFGKLVAPDTWVFSQFPQGSRYKADSDRMAALLSTLTSPYGTPYKIHRLPMVRIGFADNYRAYINSFISNNTLYFPQYGDASDDKVKALYQKALPGYEIVPVSSLATEWGDSVHCRANNLYSTDTVFVFPKVSYEQNEATVAATIYPSPTATLIDAKIIWEANGVRQEPLPMQKTSAYHYTAKLPTSSDTIRFYIEARDSKGKTKTAPTQAPAMQIDVKG